VACLNSPIPLRTKAAKGPGPRAVGIAMAYKLIDAAQTRWRAVNAPHLIIAPEVGHSSQRS
jgi:putative transposase